MPTTRARTATANSLPVTIGWQLVDGVLLVTATTPWRGGSFDDMWSVSPSLALTSRTVKVSSVQRQAWYVSRAAVRASSLVPDTTYTLSYSVLIRTDASTWAGSGSVTLTVGPDGAVGRDGTSS